MVGAVAAVDAPRLAFSEPPSGPLFCLLRINSSELKALCSVLCTSAAFRPVALPLRATPLSVLPPPSLGLCGATPC